MKSYCKILKKYFLLCTALCTCITFCSCAAQREIRRNRSNMAKIRKGMSKKQVIAIMGEPVKGEKYSKGNVLFYYTKQVWMDGLVTRDECTAIRFDDENRVISWGKGASTGIYDTDRIPVRMKSRK